MMKEIRFKAYENPKTPESGIEKALDIPNQTPKKRTVPRPAVLGSAAAAAIVAAVLLTLGLHTDSPVPVKQHTAAIAPSVPSQTEATAAPTEPSAATAPFPARQAATTPASAEPDDVPSPVVSATQAALTDGSVTTASAPPSVTPTEPTNSELQPTEAPEQPTEAPTEPQEQDEPQYYEGALTFRMNRNSEFYYSDDEQPSTLSQL